MHVIHENHIHGRVIDLDDLQWVFGVEATRPRIVFIARQFLIPAFAQADVIRNFADPGLNSGDIGCSELQRFAAPADFLMCSLGVGLLLGEVELL